MSRPHEDAPRHYSLAQIERMRSQVLVKHARGKCPRCGGTLVVDPLPHRCDPVARWGALDYGRCLL